MYPLLLFSSVISLLSRLHINSCTCSDKKCKNNYKNITETIYNVYYNNEIKLFSNDDVNNILNEISKCNIIPSNDDETQKIRLIELKNINNIKDIDVNITELKRQIKFIENISYIYLLDFFFRLMGDKEYINFMLSINGVGGPVLESAGYINLELGDILCNDKNCSKTVDLNNIYSPDITKGSKGVFTIIPIYDENNNKIYSNNENTLKLFSGNFIDLNNKTKNIQLIYFNSICEYLAQIGNPLFAICDGFEYEVSSIYNSLLMMNQIFPQLPFYKKIGDTLIKNYDIRKGGQIEKLEGEEIYNNIKKLGATKEQNMIMLAEVIVLNNLLYYVFKSAEITKKKALVNLAFSSYGGRVFEMLMSLLKNDYSNLLEDASNNKSVNVKKNSINTIFIHSLIGSNDLKSDVNNNLINFNKEKIFKDIGNKVISRDRLKYFNCNNIFGNSFESLIEYYNKKINDKKLNQIISKFTENKNNGFLKNFLRWEFDGILTSFYENKYNDGMLSQDGLFIYNNNVTRDKVSEIVSSNINNPLKNAEYKAIKGNVEKTSYSYNLDSGDGFFIIEDENIRYIHIGAGEHLCTDIKKNKDSYSIYDNRGKFLNYLLKKICNN